MRFDIYQFDSVLLAMVNLDIYKLLMIVKTHSRNKHTRQIYHYNYQIWHFSTSCMLSMILLMNKLGIATNLGI